LSALLGEDYGLYNVAKISVVVFGELVVSRISFGGIC
jgi:hypothetical protein